MRFADSTGGRRRLAGLLLLIGCAGVERRGAGGEENREHVVVGGRPVAVATRVVLWSEPNGFRATKYGERKGDVGQIVLHYDAAGTSAQCAKVLLSRGLSVHFMVDLDGTVYQMCDTSVRAYHAGVFNDGSVGIEIANVGAYAKREELERLYPIPKGVARPAHVPPPARRGPLRGRIHGADLWQQDFTDAQYEALGRLCAALCGALDIPARAPRETGVLASPAAWHGIVGHYHLTTDKLDPGPAFDWDRFLGLVGESRVPAP
jgi:N-acetyl-anhydromuramyl-L-alanine amidase AmpD